MSEWSREMAGVYTLRSNPRVQVKTYCECTYSNCMMKWAVYLDEEAGAGQSMFYSHRSNAIREALDLSKTNPNTTTEGVQQ